MEMTPIKLVDDPNMPDLKDTATIRRYLKGKFKTEEPVTNIQTGNKIEFFVGGIEAALKNRNTQSRRLFAILPEMISKSAYAGYKENTKLDTKPNIKGYETYYSVVDIDGKLNSVRIVVDIVKDETRERGYYYHQISEVDLGGTVGKSRSQSDLSQTNYPAPSGLKITLGQLTGKVNNDASKVVDENGEPLVVYHGTDKLNDGFTIQDGEVVIEPSFSEFSENGKTEAGIYFSPNQKIASNYGTPIAFFLNSRNLIREENTILSQPDNADGIYRMRSSLDSSTDAYEIAVFNANQIKSATSNNGDFSTTNNNIKFSRSTPANTTSDNDSIKSIFTKVAKNPRAVYDVKVGWI
jgi:hypothetical protein